MGEDARSHLHDYATAHGRISVTSWDFANPATLRATLRWSGVAPVPMLMDVKPAGMRQSHQDARGRIWSVVVVPAEQADNTDAEFWRTLTPEQRVVAVHGCLESALKAQGKTRVPRLRRVARVVKR